MEGRADDYEREERERQERDKVFLFEISMEIANKVGGIFTVLRSKAPTTVAEYGEQYCMIGVMSESTQKEVELREPSSPIMRQVIAEMTSKGVKVVYGRWLTDGYPKVLLFDRGSVWHRLGEWKADFWNVAHIPTPDSDSEMNDAIVFGYLTAWFLGCYAHLSSNRIIAHFHEWMVGVGLVLTRARQLNVATVFTTHATLLGRYLAAGDVDLYNSLDYINVDTEAGKRQIYHRYCLERAAAHSAHVFTTVSSITGEEAKKTLMREPDVITPNGMNVKKFTALHEFQNLHAINKERILNFIRGHFHGHLNFDFDNTLLFFTAGRYEFRNKGIDMFLESLARLNARLKLYNSNVTVVAFFVFPAPYYSLNVDSLKGQALVKQLRDTVQDIQAEVGKRIFEAAIRHKDPEAPILDINSLITQHEIVALKQRVYPLRRNPLPSVVTHNLINDAKDEILQTIRRLNLFNDDNDRVKIVYHPEFLSSTSPLLGMDYEDFIRGCHLGVFPSYYEPWGYTPAECIAMGVPFVSTNLAGFGTYIENALWDPQLLENAFKKPEDQVTLDEKREWLVYNGVHIVDRRFQSVDDSIEQLTSFMANFTLLNRRERIRMRNRTERLSDILDWSTLGKHYTEARTLALKRAFSFAPPATTKRRTQPPPSPFFKHSTALPSDGLPAELLAFNLESDSDAAALRNLQLNDK